MEKSLTLLEEVLCEVFKVEPDDESLEFIDERSIYDLSDEKDIEQRLKREKVVLNEGSAEIDDLESLARQAKEYFSNPEPVYYPREHQEESRIVTGFIQLFNGVSFTGKGEMKELWRSVGIKITCLVDDLRDEEKVSSLVASEGFDLLDENVRVIFYGNPLSEIVGTKSYEDQESKEIVSVFEGNSTIIAAIPAEYESDSSIFKNIEMEVRDSILTGEPVDYDSVALAHWRLTHDRIRELETIKQEERELERISSTERRYVKMKNQFDENFKRAREIIKGLNEGTVKPSELIDEVKVFAQVMYLCNKKGERIEKKEYYFQMKAVLKRKKLDEVTESLENKEALEIISKINKGVNIEVHHLGFEELKSILTILWGQSGIRINSQYKQKYFELKERYTHLEKVSSDNAA